MRFIGIILFILPGLLSGQVSIDFESANLNDWTFNHSDRWSLDDQSPLAGSYSLHHSYDNSESGEDIAVYPLNGLRLDLGTSVWSFKLRHGYSPSSSNKWGVYICSDAGASQMLPGGEVNGFVLGVNLSGNDDTLRLWRASSGSLTEVISSNLNWQIDVGIDSIATIRVERTLEGQWQLYLVDNDKILHDLGSGFDSNLFSISYLGIYYSYSSTKDRLLWIDDIVVDGIFLADTSAPNIEETKFISNSVVEIEFSEVPAPGWERVENYNLLPGSFKPTMVYLSEANIVRLVFDSPLENKTWYTLLVNNICDNVGNCSSDLETEVLLSYPEWGDIVISEFMSDPDPPVSLNSCEYLEIFNRSDFPINLESLSLVKGSKLISCNEMVLGPKEYLVISDPESISSFTGDIEMMGLKGFPILNNSSDYIILCDTLSGTIHGIEYSADWFNDDLKEDGGWSLEMIDSNFPFSGRSNWSYSRNTEGGSPGMQNSVMTENIDLLEPFVDNIFPLSNNELRLIFSEPVTDLSKGIEIPNIETIPIDEIVKEDSLRRVFRIYLEEDLLPSAIYTSSFVGVFDYGGNQIKNIHPQFGLTSSPRVRDLVLNEVLFDPLMAGEEYIEVFNRSDRIIDASDLKLVSVNFKDKDTSSIIILSDLSRCILPGDYYTVTEDETAVLERYFSSDQEKLFELNNLPTMPDDEGELILYSRSLEVIDKFTYNDDYHFDLISVSAGISLERIDPDEFSNLRSNWHSANGLSGWGTPGIQNSVSLPVDSSRVSTISLSSKRISPDNDGYEDIVKVIIKPGKGTWVVDATIYNDQGFPVNSIVEKKTVSGSGSFHWDGSDGHGNSLPQGIYIILVKAYSDSGKKVSWKKVCALLRR